MKLGEDKRISEAAEKADFARFSDLASRMNGLEREAGKRFAKCDRSVREVIQSVRSDFMGLADKDKGLEDSLRSLRYSYIFMPYSALHSSLKEHGVGHKAEYSVARLNGQSSEQI